jgi:hypothetical protein
LSGQSLDGHTLILSFSDFLRKSAIEVISINFMMNTFQKPVRASTPNSVQELSTYPAPTCEKIRHGGGLPSACEIGYIYIYIYIYKKKQVSEKQLSEN